MATLILPKVFVDLVSTWETVSAYSGGERSRSATVEGEWRTFANGRQRSVGTEGVKELFAFKLRDISLSTFNTLKTWISQLVQVRDHRGQQFYGTFFALNLIESKDFNLYDVEIQIGVVTFNEAV